MLSRTFVSNVEECRLEAEVSGDSGDVIAIIYEDASGWHVEQVGDVPNKLPSKFLEEVKAEMRRYVNRIGCNVPEDCTRGELALWLMLKDDGTAMGSPYLS
jgi:hypothetical protein